MKIGEFFKNYIGNDRVEVYDEHKLKTYHYIGKYGVIRDYKYSVIKEWNIQDNVLKITINTEF